MPWCEQCGAQHSANARFCPQCGRRIEHLQPLEDRQPVENDPSPDAASDDPFGTPRPLLASDVPDWISTDWPAAALSALCVLATCVGVGIVFGAIQGLATTGEAGGLISGLLTGIYRVFSMFGIETAAVRYADDATFGFGIKALPLPLAGVVVAAVAVALRFAWPRIPHDTTRSLAFVVKMAVLVSAITTVLAALLTVGDIRAPVAVDEPFAARVAVGTAALYPLALVTLIGAALLLRRGVRVGGRRLRALTDSDVARSFVAGVAAFVGIALVLSLVVLLADVAVANTGRDRIATVVEFFATGLNRGIAATVFAMGGAVDRLASHTSLFDWGSYERPGSGTAPVPLFAWLGLAPAAVAYVALRCLDRERPSTEQGVMRVVASLVAGFVLASTVLVIVTGHQGVAAGSPRAAIGLALLWGLLAAAAAGALWARSHGVRWSSLSPVEPPPTVIDTAAPTVIDTPAATVIETPDPTVIDPNP
ncbi:MAG TPA: zinc ribbon domain-containing protein [Acidimicrobiales bacterium]|nr:zinc ribbon domain-containing protein [Acidimicrobiales bacterium]